MKVIDRKLLELLHIVHDIFALGIFILIIVGISGRTREEVAATGKGIALDRKLRMKVMSGKLLELLHLLKDKFTFLSLGIILVGFRRRAIKVVASRHISITLDWKFRLHVISSKLLQGSCVLQHLSTFLFFIGRSLLRS